jgi:hypothetical protein
VAKTRLCPFTFAARCLTTFACTRLCKREWLRIILLFSH